MNGGTYDYDEYMVDTVNEGSPPQSQDGESSSDIGFSDRSLISKPYPSDIPA